jgi:predicted nucleic acid-binding Zn ribbon protein
VSAGRTRRAAGGPLEPVGDVLDELLRRLKLEERFAAADATEQWERAAGPEAAVRTRCEGVRDGVLLVSVRGSAWMADLTVRKREILERINRRLPEGARLNAIRFTPMRGREERGGDDGIR